MAAVTIAEVLKLPRRVLLSLSREPGRTVEDVAGGMRWDKVEPERRMRHPDKNFKKRKSTKHVENHLGPVAASDVLMTRLTATGRSSATAKSATKAGHLVASSLKSIQGAAPSAPSHLEEGLPEREHKGRSNASELAKEISKADLICRILRLCPNEDLVELQRLTRKLVRHRDSPDSERFRFETTQDRCIPGYSPRLLPSWKRVLVTGGTGCVGHCVLKHLVGELPNANLLSVARRRPAADSRLERVTYVSEDVRNSPRMTELMQDFRADLVIHLAAQRNPALAERRVDETVSTNNLGTQVVLDAAGAAGTASVVVASTGKAVRFFTRDVYAATKKLIEYQAAVAAKKYDGMKVSCARFTHIVNNSLVAQDILKWIEDDEPIRLHSPLVQLPVQSALECFQLLMVGGIVAESDRARIVALRDVGWPPIDLLELTLDYLAAAPRSLAPIIFTGYPAGYQAESYPGTYDPMTAGAVSPLVNCAEAVSAAPTPVLGESVDFFEAADTSSKELDERLSKLMDACRLKKNDRVIGDLLRDASEALLWHSTERLDSGRLRRIHRLGRRHNPLVDDHAFIHRRLEELLSIGSFAPI